MCISEPEVQAGKLDSIDLNITREGNGFRVKGSAVVDGDVRRIGYYDEDGVHAADEADVAYTVRYWTGLDLAMFGLDPADAHDFQMDEEIREVIAEDEEVELVGV